MALSPAAKPSTGGEAPLARRQRRLRGADAVVAVGVWMSAALTLAGLILSAWTHPLQPAATLRAGAPLAEAVAGQALPAAGGGRVALWGAGASGELLINVGLVLLMLTPVARLVALLGQFIREGDRTYAWITAGVLAVLGVGLLVGRAHA